MNQLFNKQPKDARHDLTYCIEKKFQGNAVQLAAFAQKQGFHGSESHSDLVNFAKSQGQSLHYWNANVIQHKLTLGSLVLWTNLLHSKNEIESGNVVNLGSTIDIVWLEGYKSRNETLTKEEILAVWDDKGPPLAIGDFSGRGFLTPAGLKWVKQFLTP